MTIIDQSALIARRKEYQELALAFYKLPPKKQARVAQLFCLLAECEDANERDEITAAALEILSPKRVGMEGMAGKVVDIEGGSQAGREGVEAYRKSLGVRIRTRRGELGWTQEVLAEKSGLPQSHISRLEAGQHAPTAKTIQQLAKALDLEPSQLDLLYE